MSAAGAAPRRYVVAPAASVRGHIRVPGDKSISHRALMLGGIADGLTEIEGFLDSEDCLATLAALRTLGVRIERPSATAVRVQGVGLTGLRSSTAPLDMGNAGTAMRLFMGLLSGQPFNSTLVGDASLTRRPMQRVAEPLRAMGARIDTCEGRPPVQIHGGQTLQGIDYVLPVASAQVKSALLLAGLYARGVTRVTEPAPTRDHTERMLRSFGVQLQCQSIERDGGGRTPAEPGSSAAPLHAPIRVSLCGGQRLQGRRIRVPGDFSSAAFFLVAGSLAADADEGLTLHDIGCNPTRTGLLELLRLMGARIELRPAASSSVQGAAAGERAGSKAAASASAVSDSAASAAAEPIADLHVRASRLRGIRVPEHLVPLAIDEFPVFFIAAACAEGETVVTGAAELRVKESDRLAVMADGLGRLGVECELLPDGLRLRGGATLRGGRIDSHGDHRIAMAFAIASLRASAPIEIDDVANVATSFPGFAALARSVGLALRD